MEKISSVLFAGAGAIGAMVAAQFLENGASVSILAGGERLERYRTNGITVNGKKANFTYTDVAENTNPDLIIIACKYNHLPQIIADIKNHVAGETLILSLLNGIDSEAILGKVYGTERLPLAYIIGTDAQRTGTDVSFSNRGIIVFGDAQNTPGSLSKRVALIADYFDKYGVAYEVPENMIYKQWYKFMINIGTNQPSSITRATYLPFQTVNGKPNCPEMYSLMTDAMKELIAVAKAEGIGLDESDIKTASLAIDKLNPASRTSMCQDMLAGRKTEIDMFAPVVIALGKKHGIPTPVNDIFYRQIRAIEFSL